MKDLIKIMGNFQSKLTILTFVMLASFGAQAANVASTFNSGDTLTATQMTEIKDAVNDNDTRVNDNDIRLDDNDTRLDDNDTKLNDIDTRLDDNDTRLSGVEFVGSSVTITATSVASTLLSVVVTAPSDGFAIVSFSSSLRIDHSGGSLSFSRLWISTDPASTATADETLRYFEVSSAEDTGSYWESTHSQAVFPVTAGTTSFFARADAAGSGARYERSSMNAIFVPNRY